MKLSILICSLIKRESDLWNLLDVLFPQYSEEIEILTCVDDGKISVGKKRNTLLDQAIGDYIAYIDDDDLVSPNYVQKILDAIKASPDCVGIEGIYTSGGQNPKKFIHSLKIKAWSETPEAYLRNPNHLNPVKRIIALQVRFPEVSFREDMDYSKRLLPFLKSEVYIPEPIYFYRYDCDKSETKKFNIPTT